MLLEHNLIKNIFGKCTCACQSEATESRAHGRGYLEFARKDHSGKHFVTVLFDKGIHELCKCIPLPSLCILIVGVLYRMKLLLKLSHFFVEAETGFG
jgi:hypothetical protein